MLPIHLIKGEFMEVIKRKTGTRYREMIRISGNVIKGPAFLRKSDAKEWKSRMEMEKSKCAVNGDSEYINVKITFAEFANKWLEEKIRSNCAARTYEHYTTALRVHLLPMLGEILVQHIREEHGRKLVTKLQDSGHRPKGINNIVGVLKSIMNYAVKKHYIFKHPFENISKQRADLTCEAYWTKKEIEQFFLPNSQHELYALFFTAIHTGMRLAELCGLCWDRVDFGLNQITVTRMRDKVGLRETTKTKMKRIIPMVPMVKNLLWGLMKRQLNPIYVFAKETGEEVDYGHVYRAFKLAQRRAGIKRLIRFHDLRHTFASQFMMNGGNLFDLQKILGHTKIEITMRYAHFSPEHLQTATRFMDMGLAVDFSEPQSEPRPKLEANLGEDFLQTEPLLNHRAKMGEILHLSRQAN